MIATETNNNETIEIRVLEDPKTNWRLLREYFFETRAVHPLGSVMKSLHTDDGRAIQEAWLRHITATGNCPVVIAWDTEQEKVAGAILMRGINREISKQPPGEQPGNINVNMENMDNEMVELWKNMMAFFGPIEYNVLEKHPEIEWYAEIHSLGVLTEYSKRGIGQRLLRKALSVLQELEYPLALGIFVSSFSIRIAKKLDFQRVSGHTYKDNYLDYHKMPEHVQSVHKECFIMIKLL